MKEDRLESFAKVYVRTRNGTKAAMEVGISKTSARNWASQALKKPKVKEMIAKFDKSLEMRVGVSRERVLKQFMKIGFCEIDEILNPDGSLKKMEELSENAKAAIAGVEVEEIVHKGQVISIVKKVKVRDSKSALDSISKMLGYNEPEKVDVSGTVETLDEGCIAKLSKQERIIYFGLRKKMYGDSG